VERQNGRKSPENLKDGMMENSHEILRGNDGKSPKLLKDKMTENHPKSYKKE